MYRCFTFTRMIHSVNYELKLICCIVIFRLNCESHSLSELLIHTWMQNRAEGNFAQLSSFLQYNKTPLLKQPLPHFVLACLAWFHIDTDNFSLRLTMQPLDRTSKKVRAKIEDPIPMVQHALFLPLVSLICSGIYCV